MVDLDIDSLANEIYEAVREEDEDNTNDNFKEGDIREIKEILEPIFGLINEAKQKRMYLFIKPCQKWFSPFEIEQKLRTGYYVFTSNNWELRNPTDRIAEIEKEIDTKIEEINDIIIYLKGIKVK